MKCLGVSLDSSAITGRAVRDSLCVCVCLIGSVSPLNKCSCSILGGMLAPGMAGDSFGSQSLGDSLNLYCLVSVLGPRVGSLQWALVKAFHQEGWLMFGCNGVSGWNVSMATRPSGFYPCHLSGITTPIITPGIQEGVNFTVFVPCTIQE